jgi:hypothetical protein
MAHPPLTNGACLKLMEQDTDVEGFQPILQCLSVKKLGIASAAGGNPDRYRYASDIFSFTSQEVGRAYACCTV